MNNTYGEKLVTAIITTHNRVDMLVRAVQSVLNQTYGNIEIIVSDDGSTDGTQAYLTDLSHVVPRLTYLRSNTSEGACAARNKAIRMAKGFFVAGLDDDDEWEPSRIQCLISAYDPKYSLVSSWDEYRYGDRAEIIERPSIVTLEQMKFKNCIGNQVLVETQRLLRLGGFDQSLPAAQDYDMWFRVMLSHGDAYVCQKVLQFVYVQHQGFRITASRKQFSGYLRFFNKHKEHLDTAPRQAHIFNLYRCRSKRLSFKNCRRLYNKHIRRELLVYAIMTSRLKNYLQGLILGRRS